MTVESADVVISGAGRNGLMLASELALAGVRPVVLDRLPGPSDEPKANGLVGQVIRQLDMRGLYHAFGGDDGPPQPTYGWMFAGMALNFLGVEDNPMYVLLLQQPRLVRLLEKRARDLGAGPLRAAADIVLPLSEKGLSVAFLMAFLVSVGDYVTPRYVGGGASMMGHFIETQFSFGFNWPMGSAMSFTLMAVSLIIYLLLRAFFRRLVLP